MFDWLFKDKNELNETKEIQKLKADNYRVDDGNIIINAYCEGFYYYNYSISKESIISQTEDRIVFKDYINTYNNVITLGYGNRYADYGQAIENKEKLIEYKETQIKTFTYYQSEKRWYLSATEIVGREVTYEKTLLDIFEKEYKSKYKLIETEDEFNDYLSSALDCDTWCRKKLYNKMKELGLGDGFINQFADLIGNNLDKYYAMIDLANESSDKDTLMYLYTYKFR